MPKMPYSIAVARQKPSHNTQFLTVCTNFFQEVTITKDVHGKNKALNE